MLLLKNIIGTCERGEDEVSRMGQIRVVTYLLGRLINRWSTQSKLIWINCLAVTILSSFFRLNRTVQKCLKMLIGQKVF